jgi:hypothetical protein
MNSKNIDSYYLADSTVAVLLAVPAEQREAFIGGGRS